ncbi:relaxase/mobilization nuclease domain-containing protein [Acetobacterium bakii]|nr:relaxase/mobilization nuclease domain-containing protein [Acetobacterium bakii]
MKNCIDYVKKMEDENHLVSTINCSSDSAYEEFLLTKNMYHKENGRLYIHAEQSFPPGISCDPQLLHDIGRRLIEETDIFKGFQVVIGTHTDCDHVHNHFCINSVNAETGAKWHISKADLEDIKIKSLELCREENIAIWWDKKNSAGKEVLHEQSDDKLHTVKQGEYEKQKQGQSWKFELFLAVKECTKHSFSQEEFISNMGKLGYETQWDQHKHITFTTPEGKKCRNNKLYPPERFTKENLLKQFENNCERRSERTRRIHQKEMDDFVKNASTVLTALKTGKSNGSNYYPLTHMKKKLEGEALREKMKQKENSSYDWEQEM